jgi:Bacterial regulatory helix-turn-helix proteins, AraC family
VPVTKDALCRVESVASGTKQHTRHAGPAVPGPGNLSGIPVYIRMEEPGRFHDATLVRIRQPDRTGGAALPVADEKGRHRRLRCEFFRLAFPSLVRDVCGPRKSARVLANHSVLDYIANNLEENIGLSQLATIADMSQHYFSELFKQSTGYTPHSYYMFCCRGWSMPSNGFAIPNSISHASF